MHTLTATFEIVTPMFLGGADNTASVELRVPPIKGALRFWWRALAWGRFCQAHPHGTPAEIREILKKIREEEARIFGSAEGGQGRILMRMVQSNYQVIQATNQAVLRDRSERVVGSGARYLGYGLMSAQLSRPCIREGATFTIELRFARPRPAQNPAETARLKQEYDSDLPTVVEAIKLFGLLGGIGARTRRGWGSVTLSEMKIVAPPENTETTAIAWEKPTTIAAYTTAIQNIVRPRMVSSGTNVEMTCFALETRINVSNWNVNDPLEALHRIGWGMQRYRANGQNGQLRRPGGGNVDSEGIFIDDHDWYHGINNFSYANGGRRNYVAERAAFGLPHNYKDNFGVTGTNNIDRRASPLMIHVHKISDQFVGVVTTLPTQFLPTNSVNAGGLNCTYTFDPTVLTDFLDCSGTAAKTGNTPFFESTPIIP